MEEPKLKQSNLTPRPRATRRIAGHAQQDHILDPYQRQQKLHDRTICPQCGALYHEGRWRWMARAEGAFEALCTACRRINDKFPAGVVTLQGAFAREHKEEIIRLVRHQEEAEKREHPLNRIISIEEDADGFVINTTDIHLPRRIGEGVKRAFHGKLEDHFEKDGYFVRVNWSREA
jgi:NMD protein affecting ribosome stability and mRNA decay